MGLLYLVLLDSTGILNVATIVFFLVDLDLTTKSAEHTYYIIISWWHEIFIYHL